MERNGAATQTAHSNLGGPATIIGVVPTQLRAEFFSPAALQDIELLARNLGGVILWFEDGPEFNRVVAGGAVFEQARVMISSWATPKLEGALLAAMPNLTLLAHTGATVRPFVSPQLFDAEITVTQAGEAMGRPVAEVALTFTLCLLHQIHTFTHHLHGGQEYVKATARGQREINGSAIGVVGASRTGRQYIALVQALGGKVSVYDPYLSSQEAISLNVAKVELEHLMATNQVVAVHAPSLPQTRHMINAQLLSLMVDGAGLVNTARSWLVDEQALIAEASSGRIDAAVDVFDQEPMALDHPFRALPNVLLTPHRAAGTVQGRLRAGDIVRNEITRHLSGQSLGHQILKSDLERMA